MSTKLFLKTVSYSAVFLFATAVNVHGQSPAEQSDAPDTPARVVILFQFDRSNMDRNYMNNAESLDALLSIMSERTPVLSLDSIIVTGSSSPDGNPAHNRILAQRRANSIRDFIIENYDVDPSVCIARADGGYWDGLIGLVEQDPDVPARDGLLKTMKNPALSDDTKTWRLNKMHGGQTIAYLRSNHTLRRLRQGSVVITFGPDVITSWPPAQMPEGEPKPEQQSGQQPQPAPEKPARIPRPKLPFAVRTNLLLDLMGGPNIGIEVPVGNHFSAAGDFAYAYMRICNRYALQTIQGTLEARYWFKQRRNILTGWNLGVYGTYSGRFDIQMDYGYQGDRFWSCGLTGGYAVPIGRRLNLDFSVAGGYFYSPEIREYSKPQNGHLVWEKTTYNASRIALTQVRVNLVWLINTKVK